VLIGLGEKAWIRDIRIDVSVYKLKCMERQIMVSSDVLSQDTARHTFGRDDSILVTAWCLRADYGVAPQ
jgi:hypothetical protein